MAPLCPTPNFKFHLVFASTSIDVDVELPPILPSHHIVYETPSSSLTPNVFVTIFEIPPHVDIVVNPKFNVIANLKPIQPKK
jgi:hypothetical protein